MTFRSVSPYRSVFGEKGTPCINGQSERRNGGSDRKGTGLASSLVLILSDTVYFSHLANDGRRLQFLHDCKHGDNHSLRKALPLGSRGNLAPHPHFGQTRVATSPRQCLAGSKRSGFIDRISSFGSSDISSQTALKRRQNTVGRFHHKDSIITICAE